MGQIGCRRTYAARSPACGFHNPAAFVEMIEPSIAIGLQDTGKVAQSHAVLVLPVHGANTGMGVSSACSFEAASSRVIGTIMCGAMR